MGAIEGEWAKALAPEFRKPYYTDLYKFIKEEYSNHVVYPPSDEIFNALHLTDLHNIKVVILGQDPYHEPGQAHGLCFSVRPDVDIPPSLVNIYKELHDDLGCKIPNNGYLEHWAKQGVLLLNTLLTVRAHQAFSHKGMGWEQFTTDVIELLNLREKPMVFMLWGSDAKAKQQFITNPNHLILRAAHPSPLSAYNGFFGCRHFWQANAFLRSNGMEEIDWSID